MTQDLSLIQVVVTNDTANIEMGGSTAGEIPTFELTDGCEVRWRPGDSLVSVPNLLTYGADNGIFGATSGRGRRAYIIENSRFFCDDRIGENNTTAPAGIRRPGLQLANATTVSIAGSSFENWWMNWGSGLLLANATLSLATRNHGQAKNRYRCRISGNANNNSWGMFLQCDIASFIADPLISESTGYNTSNSTGTGIQWWNINCEMPAIITCGINTSNANGLTLVSGFAWNPVYRSAADDSVISTIKYNLSTDNLANAYTLPSTFDTLTQPVLISNNINKPANGFLFRNDTAQPVTAGTSVNLTAQDPSVFSTINVKDYDHVLETLQPGPVENSLVGDAATNSITFAVDTNRTDLAVEDARVLEVDAILNGRSQASALDFLKTDLDEAYTQAKAYWYDDNSFQNLYTTEVPVADGVIDFNRDVSFTSAGANTATFASGSVAFRQTGNQQITEGTFIHTIDCGNTGKYSTAGNRPIQTGVIAEEIIWSNSENLPDVSNDIITLAETSNGRVLSALISLPANLTDERYRIDGFDISNLTINADTDTGVLIEFLNTTGTPTLGTGVTQFFTPTQTTVELTADLPTGFYILRNLDSNTNLFEGTHTTGVATDIASLDNAASTTNYRLYYLPQYISSGTKRFYQVTVTDFINDDTSGDKIVTAAATEIADVLTADAENTTPGSETGTFSLPTSTTGRITISRCNKSVISCEYTEINVVSQRDGKFRFVSILTVNGKQ